MSPLHTLAVHGGVEAEGGLGIAELLLSHAPDLELRARTKQPGVTPLHIAALLNKAWLVALLAHSGADLNATNDFGNTPLHLAGKYDARDAVAVLRELGARVDDIYLAAAVDDIPLTRTLLASGQANFVDWEGEPPLGWAVRNHSVGVVQALLADPVAAGITQDDLNLALVIAVQLRDEIIARMLLEAGADPSVRDKDGKPVIHNADGVATLQALAEFGVDLGAIDSTGDSGLHSAATAHSLPAVNWWLEHGANVNAIGALEEYLLAQGAIHTQEWLDQEIAKPLYTPDWLRFYDPPIDTLLSKIDLWAGIIPNPLYDPTVAPSSCADINWTPKGKSEAQP
jgi:ankyrin repeat protein